MRFDRLDLFRYGRFTDVSIDLPRSHREFHILFGPNEAGKTTTLTAISEVLFGIHTKSPYNFLHTYAAMRVGAVLENGNDRFEYQRRKGRKDTVLGPNGDPLQGDQQLVAQFLGGIDRDFFDRMFNLSHDRLAEGGRAILEAKDDVGQMLFAAGTGLADLRERLKQLEEEADQLWAPRKSGKRLYYQAKNRWEDARARQREHSLSVSSWRSARATLEKTEETQRVRQRAHDEISRRLKKLARIRRVHSALRRQRELTQKIAALGEVIVLPEDASEQLAHAKSQETKIRTQRDILVPQLEEIRQTLEGIEFDEALVRRSEEIIRLNEMRIELRGERDDLPKRRSEYRLELESLDKLASEIGWDCLEPSELIERIPARSKVEPVRGLLTQHGELVTELRSARKSLDEAQAAVQDKKKRLEELGSVTDVSRLAAVLTAIRSIGDVSGRVHAAQRQVDEIAGDIRNKLQSMNPALPEDTDIEALLAPPRDSVIEHRDNMRNWTQRSRETKQRLKEARDDLERDEESFSQRVRDEGIVAPGAVEEARRRRNGLWGRVKAQYITRSAASSEDEEPDVGTSENLAASFEEAVEHADSIVDRRLDKSQEAGELAVLDRNINAHKTRIKQLEADGEVLKVEEEQLKTEWQALWAGVPVTTLSPDSMLAWLQVHGDVMTLIDRKRDLQLSVQESRREEQNAIAQIRTVLMAVGWDAKEFEADDLRVLVERADAYRGEEEKKSEKIIEMREAVRVAQLEVALRQREREHAEAQWKSWQEDWATAVRAIDLLCEDKPDALSAQISVLDEMREHAGVAKDLRDKRIATIERDIDLFQQAVKDLVAELAPDLTEVSADTSVRELDQRREAALEQHKQYQDLSKSVAASQRRIEELEQARKDGWTSVQPLLEAAGVEEVDALREKIERSDQLRRLTDELGSIRVALDQQGDGLAIEALEEECLDVDIDSVRVREEAAEAELAVLAEQLENAIVARTEARNAFEAIGGDDAAARAATDCEEALASMQDAAERYVRVRAGGILLRWAVERFRKKKQGPLLKRAGELFRALTRNSFKSLDVIFDEHDKMHLTGMRPDGMSVAVPGLSSGTEDQLFLALRVAAVEDYLARAEALPFVADDLFVNFDAERSAAGLEVLGQLAERTQVLFFTHHWHLVELARETLGTDVHVTTLTSAA